MYVSKLPYRQQESTPTLRNLSSFLFFRSFCECGSHLSNRKKHVKLVVRRASQEASGIWPHEDCGVGDCECFGVVVMNGHGPSLPMPPHDGPPPPPSPTNPPTYSLTPCEGYEAKITTSTTLSFHKVEIR